MHVSFARFLMSAALLGGALLPAHAAAEACSAIHHEVLQIAAGREEWTSAHARINPGDVILVYASGTARIAGAAPSTVTPRGGADGIGGLEMLVGTGTVVPTGSRWFGTLRDHGSLKFRVYARRRDALSGAYKVNLVVIPAGVFPDAVVFDEAAP